MGGRKLDAEQQIQGLKILSKGNSRGTLDSVYQEETRSCCYLYNKYRSYYQGKMIALNCKFE